MKNLTGLGQFRDSSFGFFGGLSVFSIELRALWYLSLDKKRLENAGKI